MDPLNLKCPLKARQTEQQNTNQQVTSLHFHSIFLLESDELGVSQKGFINLNFLNMLLNYKMLIIRMDHMKRKTEKIFESFNSTKR